MLLRKSLLLIFLACLGLGLQAHKADQSYIFLRILENGIEGTFQFTTKDLNSALDLDLQEGMTAEAFAPYLQQVRNYIVQHTDFTTNDGALPIEFTDLSFMQTGVGYFVKQDFVLAGVEQVPDAMDISYSGIYDQDPLHQGLVIVRYNWKAGIHDNETLPSLIFGENLPETQTLDLSEVSIWKGFVAMVKSGMWHIWIGLDHILFLLALVLPAVVYRKQPEDWSLRPTLAGSNWYPVERFKPAFFYVLKIVTLFTIAHSITLSLASFQIVTLPSWLVETIIAFSIALAAAHNIRPFVKNEALVIAFGFGLFHGFGFASVLGEVGVQGEYMGYTILGFNLGVELCQILLISVMFPILYLLRKWKHYRKILVFGSMFLILIALNWVLERSLDIDLLLDNYLSKAFRMVTGIFG